jgi:hypothetical protein
MQGFADLGLWISVLKKLANHAAEWYDQWGKLLCFRGTPPPPHPLNWLARRGARKKCLQNLDCRWVRGQNLDNKGVRAVVDRFDYTAFASTMMN